MFGDNHEKPPFMRRNPIYQHEKTLSSEQLNDDIKEFQKYGGKINKLNHDEFGQDPCKLSKKIRKIIL